MWPFKRTLSEQYSKLVKLIKSIDPNFQMTENKEDSLRLHLPNYKEDQPKGFHIKRILVAFLMILPATFVFAQRYSGHGRGLSNDSFDFGSPSVNETLTMLIVAVIAIPLSSLFINIANKKEEGKGTIYWILGGICGLAGAAAALPLVFHFWYIVVLLIILIALYGAYKDSRH